MVKIMNEQEKGYVYLIRAVGTNNYKIGVTRNDPQHRLAGLKTGSPHELCVIQSAYVENYKSKESWLHKEFHCYQMNGEWFSFDGDSLVQVKMAFIEIEHGLQSRNRAEIYSLKRDISQLKHEVAWRSKSIDELVNRCDTLTSIVRHHGLINGPVYFNDNLFKESISEFAYKSVKPIYRHSHTWSVPRRRWPSWIRKIYYRATGKGWKIPLIDKESDYIIPTTELQVYD